MSRTRVHLMGLGFLISALALSGGLGAAVALPSETAKERSDDASRLVEKVRETTAVFRDVNAAAGAGYGAFGGCVSGPDDGAMGVHFVNQEFLRDGEIDVNKPEALIYEFKNGQARLVGVEFIVLAEQWDPAHAEPPVAPVLEGQLFHFNDSPNRFRLKPFYELHVWAWRDNPRGAFVDWNPLVSCDGQ